MTDSQDSGVPQQPRRRRLQVSLRTLLVLVTLLGLGLGWFVHRGERQRRAVAALTAMRGRVYYELPGTEPAEKAFDLSRWLPRDYLDHVYWVNSPHAIELLSRPTYTEAIIRVRVACFGSSTLAREEP